MFCTKKDFFVQSIRNPAGKSKDSDQFSAQRQVHHRFGTVGGVLSEHCPAAMGGGDLLHYIQAKDMGCIFGRLRSVQRRQNGSRIADAVIRYGRRSAPLPAGCAR